MSSVNFIKEDDHFFTNKLSNINSKQSSVIIENGEFKVTVIKSTDSDLLKKTKQPQNTIESENIKSKFKKSSKIKSEIIKLLIKNKIKPLNLKAVPFNERVENHPTMQAFNEDKGPKILIVGEGHGSLSSLCARRLIASNNEIRGFSEGKTGHPLLHGIPGLENYKDFEIAPLLKEFKQYENSKHKKKMINSSEKLNKELLKLGIDRKDHKRIFKKFINITDNNKREEEITYFQNHRRDFKFAGNIRKECFALKKSNLKIGVGFFGATHIFPWFDDKMDVRTTENRIPEFLLKQGGVKMEHCIKIAGVNVYFYPKVLSENEEDPDFCTLFKIA